MARWILFRLITVKITSTPIKLSACFSFDTMANGRYLILKVCGYATDFGFESIHRICCVCFDFILKLWITKILSSSAPQFVLCIHYTFCRTGWLSHTQVLVAQMCLSVVILVLASMGKMISWVASLSLYPEVL